MKLFEFNTEDNFVYENGYHITSDVTRIGKIITHYELYKKIINIPGEVIECGVFKGSSLIRFATFRGILENPNSRKIVGFDTFGDFPNSSYELDKKYVDNFVKAAGNRSISLTELKKVFEYKKFINYELIAGNIIDTIPEYIINNPALKIALLHIDVDIYEPTKVILEYMYDKVVKNGVLILDDYSTFPGETKAVDEFVSNKNIIIRKFPFSHKIPCYIIKE